MSRLFTALAMFAVLMALSLKSADAQRAGITADSLLIFDDASMPSKEFRVLRTTYAPSGQNPKHYHPSHVVFTCLKVRACGRKMGRNRLRSSRATPCTCVPA